MSEITEELSEWAKQLLQNEVRHRRQMRFSNGGGFVLVWLMAIYFVLQALLLGFLWLLVFAVFMMGYSFLFVHHQYRIEMRFKHTKRSLAELDKEIHHKND